MSVPGRFSTTPAGVRVALHRRRDDAERLLDDVGVRVGTYDRVLREPRFVDGDGAPIALEEVCERIDRQALTRTELQRIVRRIRDEDTHGR